MKFRIHPLLVVSLPWTESTNSTGYQLKLGVGQRRHNRHTTRLRVLGVYLLDIFLILQIKHRIGLPASCEENGSNCNI